MQEKYNDFFKELGNLFPMSSSRFDNLLDNFSYTKLCDIDYIDNNFKKFTKEQWEEYYIKYEGDALLLLNMINKESCPNDIVIKVVQQLLPLATTPESSELEICRLACVYHELPEDLLYDVISKHPTEFVVFVSDHTDKLPIKNINTICKYISEYPELFKLDAKISYTADYRIAFINKIFERVENKNFLLDLIKDHSAQFDNDFIRTFVVNNKLFDTNDSKDVELIDELFSDGLVYNLLNKVTPQIIEYFVNNFANFDFETFEDEEIFAIIVNVAINHLSDAIEYDLVRKYLSAQQNPNSVITSDAELVIANILQYTNNEEVMKLGTNLSMNEVLWVTENKNAPLHILKLCAEKIIDGYINKKEHGTLGYDFYYSNYPEVLMKLSAKIAFSDSHYEDIIDKCTYHYLTLAIASSPLTPTKHIEHLINKCLKDTENQIGLTKNDGVIYQNVSVILAAKINLLKREGLIGDNSIEIDTFQNLQASDNYLTFSLKCGDITSLEECEEVVTALKSSFSTIDTDSDKLKTIFDSAGNNAYKYIKDIYEKSLIKPNDFSKHTTEQLKKDIEIFLNISSEEGYFSIPDFVQQLVFYKKLPELVDLFENFKAECNKREDMNLYKQSVELDDWDRELPL
jgi:hypothetical protein